MNDVIRQRCRHRRVAALEQLRDLAYREAATMAYADAFRAIMVAFVVATLLVPLMRKVAVPVQPTSARPANPAH
jgi:MFS transporter, DHA2 family, multidrug resistance protein